MMDGISLAHAVKWAVKGVFDDFGYARIVNLLVSHGNWLAPCRTNVGAIPLLPFRAFIPCIAGLVTAEANNGLGSSIGRIGSHLLLSTRFQRVPGPTTMIRCG